MIPMHFDEHERLVGTLSVKIRFKNALEAAWKPMYMILPTNQLEIDTPNLGKTKTNIYFYLIFNVYIIGK